MQEPLALFRKHKKFTTRRLSTKEVKKERYPLLLTLLAILLPFHTYIGIRPLRVNTSLGDSIVLLTLVLFILGFISSQFLPRYIVTICVFLSLVAISIIVNYLIGISGYHSISILLLEYVKLFGAIAWFMAVALLFSYNPRHALWIFSIFSVAIATLFSIYSLVEIISFEVSRPDGPFENPNIYSNYLVFNVFLSLVLLKLDKSRLVVWFLAMVILVAGVLATASRGGLAGIIAGFCFLGLYYITQSGRTKLIKYSPAALLFVPVFFLWQETRSYEIILNTVANPGGEASNRIERWGYAVDSFVANPMFGIGYGQFAQATPSSTGVHSTLLSIGTEAGIFALAAFVLLLILVTTDTIRIVYNSNEKYLIFVVAMFVASLAQGLVTDVYTFRTFWIVIGIIAAFYRFEYGVNNVKS